MPSGEQTTRKYTEPPDRARFFDAEIRGHAEHLTATRTRSWPDPRPALARHAPEVPSSSAMDSATDPRALPTVPYLDALAAEGVTHVVGLPDSTLAPLFDALGGAGRSDRPPRRPMRWVGVTREGEAFAVASGLWLGGAVPVVAVQCTGLMASGDAFRGTAQRMAVPLVILVTWRGHRTLVAAGLEARDPPFDEADLIRADVDSAALLVGPTLRAWNVPWEVMGPDGAALPRAFARARRESRPVALLLTGGPG
jgi:hypothetical protein